MKSEDKINNVLKAAVDAVKARHDGALPADELCIHLACEVVARDTALAELGELNASRIAAKLDIESRHREAVMREALTRIAKLPTDQLAPAEQCEAVVIAMDALSSPNQ